MPKLLSIVPGSWSWFSAPLVRINLLTTERGNRWTLSPSCLCCSEITLFLQLLNISWSRVYAPVEVAQGLY